MKFFKKIRQVAISENKFWRYITYAFGEIILVVIGILIALTINNWNQNRSERTLEQGYISALMEDAQTDLANFDSIISLNESRVLHLDSLAALSYNFEENSGKDAELMIWYIKSLKHPDFITQTDRTLSQLKNSGMRLIESKAKIDAIINYEKSFEKLTNQQQWYEGGLKELVEVGIHIFNYQFFPKPNQNLDPEIFFKETRLQNTNPQAIIELGNRATTLSLFTSSYLRFLEEGKQECKQLIDILKRKD